MNNDLYTTDGKRKYLTQAERLAFIAAANAHPRAEVRTFGLVMAYTGCRISEALQLLPNRVDPPALSLVFKTLKQRGADVTRTIPVPEGLLDTLELVHGIRKARRGKKGQGNAPLWPWQHNQAYNHIKELMASAGIEGAHATPKGLRHGFGVQAAASSRNPRLVQKWLGHRYLETTLIYMDAVGDEERAAAAGMWE